MTLEQIEQRQKGLNKLLELHLEELTVVIDRITGKGETSATLGKESKTPNGIIEEIGCTLNDLELNIDRLLTLKHRLCEHTFAPVEIAE